VVLAITFSDSQQWIARIRLPADSSLDSDVEASMISEITTMQLVRKRTSIPVPHVYGFNVDAKNPFGFRYILMEALPGLVPDRGLAHSVPKTYWDKVTKQFADYYYQLSTIRFSRIGTLTTGPNIDQEPHIASADGPTTSIEYFYSLRKSHTKEITSAHAGDESWGTAAWILEQAVPTMVGQEFLRGPFPLCHIDLHYKNILVDDEFNITGIIDWSDAQTVPIERFLITPEFVTFPGLSAEENAPIIAFRDMFAAALRKKEAEATEKSDDEGKRDGERLFMADLLGTPLWEIVYRCTYSYHWRALSDARLVMRQMYGAEAKWEDFVEFYRNSPARKGGKALEGPLVFGSRGRNRCP
jgi:hypothetical protein